MYLILMSISLIMSEIQNLHMGISFLCFFPCEPPDPILAPVFLLAVGLYLIDKGLIVYEGNEPCVPPLCGKWVLPVCPYLSAVC